MEPPALGTGERGALFEKWEALDSTCIFSHARNSTQHFIHLFMRDPHNLGGNSSKKITLTWLSLLSPQAPLPAVVGAFHSARSVTIYHPAECILGLYIIC